MPSLFNVNTTPAPNAHLGPAVIFYAPYGTTFPTDVTSVVNLTGASNVQWTPTSAWTTLGATKSGIKVERGFTKVDRTSDQSFGPFDTRPNHWTATVTTEMLETTPENLQLAWEGAPVSSTVTGAATTLSAAAAAAATSVTLTGAPGTVSSGTILIIGNNMAQEWHKIASVSGTTYNFFAGETLQFAQASGAYVLNPGKKSVGFGHPRNLTPRMLAVVAPLTALSTTAQGNVDTIRMWAFRITRLGEGNKTMNLTQDNDWVLPVSFNAYRDTAVTDETQDTFTVFDYVVV